MTLQVRAAFYFIEEMKQRFGAEAMQLHDKALPPEAVERALSLNSWRWKAIFRDVLAWSQRTFLDEPGAANASGSYLTDHGSCRLWRGRLWLLARRRMAAGRDPRFQVRFENSAPPLAEGDYGRTFTSGDSPFQRAPNKVRAPGGFIVGENSHLFILCRTLSDKDSRLNSRRK
jgi:hypothetical protein